MVNGTGQGPMAPRGSVIRPKLRRAGFTLIEALIVVLLVGIIAMVGLPLMNSALTEARLNAVATEIVAAIEFAQLSSVSTARPCRVTLDVVAETLTVEQLVFTTSFMGTELSLPEASVETTAFQIMAYPPNRSQGYVVDFSDPNRLATIDIVSVNFSGLDNVEFDRLGAPSNGGTITVETGGMQALLTVDSLSGKVTQN